MTAKVSSLGRTAARLERFYIGVEAATLARRGIEAKPLPRGKEILGHLLSGLPVTLITYRLSVLRRPFAIALLLRLLSRSSCVMEDLDGNRRAIHPWTVAHLAGGFLRDFLASRRVRSSVERTLRAPGKTRALPRLNEAAPPAYLRTDLWFGVESGGSIAHTSGVLAALGELAGQRPTLITTDDLPGVDQVATCWRMDLGSRFWDFPEVLALAANETIETQATEILSPGPVAFVYHRYSVYSFVGARVAERLGVPLVLEYNGSEVWISKRWGKRLEHETLAEEIELINLKAADVVVVVSQPMHDELVRRGVASSKILVNPNGVDRNRYSPSIDGAPIRSQLSLEGKEVFGFIGTFGAWHGAEVLARSFAHMLSDDPGLRERVRLLMIGDGPRLAATKAIVDKANIGDAVIFAGRTRQEDGPSYLAACDILLSPHVPNEDGTPFFGSPTKLFEYMAMGKPIIASRLEQIGDVLRDDVTAVLVPPADVPALADAMRSLLDDRDRRGRLGAAAREDAVANHTWREHTHRIVEKLRVTNA